MDNANLYKMPTHYRWSHTNLQKGEPAYRNQSARRWRGSTLPAIPHLSVVWRENRKDPLTPCGT